MALPNISGTIIASGFNCKVRAGSSATDAQVIALVASFQATEDFQTQEAQVIGHLGPVSLDPQGYSCSITMDGFLPAKGILDGASQYTGSGTSALTDILKNQTREKFMEAALMNNIVYLDFVNTKNNEILAAFKGVILTSYGISVDGASYVKNNVQMRALEMERAGANATAQAGGG